MEFLIDRKFWNLVIKKLKPNTALLVKQGLKKPPGKYSSQAIKKDLVLSFHDSKKQVFDSGFFNYYCLSSLGFLGATAEEQYEIELAMLEVLIETQGMSEKTQYCDDTGNVKYIIDQCEPISTVEKGFVYLIRNDDIYKIGITDNLLRRFNQLKPDEVLNVVRCSNFESLEKQLHKKFKGFRIPQTEYFRLSKSQIEQVNIEMTKGANF